ncbi:hypothetical protein [Aliarcobacter butzleri]|nr:hypothetical protein [Aliarcobacter butzleri]
MKLAISLSILLGASTLFATSLVQKAKDSGLDAKIGLNWTPMSE